MIDPDLDDDDALLRWAALGSLGVTVSVCCGPSGPAKRLRWSVDVLNRDGVSFNRPFAADSFRHAIAIAVHEVVERGWLKPEDV